ncbi:MAG: hypothetical protein LBQ83_00615 [Candidatus Margulisbacteria bacterium]|jgi:flagellar basal body rod protein FlgG|nr:hypothetical protein [Candidatus Margulisiibacteriota bacterium]
MMKITKIILALGLCSLLPAAPSNKSTVQALNIYEQRYGAMMSNVVNVNTPGFRATQLLVVEENGNLVTTRAPTLFANGQLIFSGDPLHIGIDGPGFFMARTPEGVIFMRDGRFTLSEDFTLVTLSGHYPVQGRNGNIQFSMSGGESSMQFEVTETGLIIKDNMVVDKVLVGELAPEATLSQLNGVFFEALEGESVYTPLETPRVRQYYYESSNVNMSEELVAMPDISKKYDANAKVLQILKKIRTTGREMGSAQ